jgi:hypothetical protein
MSASWWCCKKMEPGVSLFLQVAGRESVEPLDAASGCSQVSEEQVAQQLSDVTQVIRWL